MNRADACDAKDRPQLADSNVLAIPSKCWMTERTTKTSSVDRKLRKVGWTTRCYVWWLSLGRVAVEEVSAVVKEFSYCRVCGSSGFSWDGK